MLEEISDSEVASRITDEEKNARAHNKTTRTLDMLQIQMDSMNQGLDDVHSQIIENADNTCEFLGKIIEDLEAAKMPEVT